jgi:hypothetical protein
MIFLQDEVLALKEQFLFGLVLEFLHKEGFLFFEFDYLLVELLDLSLQVTDLVGVLVMLRFE